MFKCPVDGGCSFDVNSCEDGLMGMLEPCEQIEWLRILFMMICN